MLGAYQLLTVGGILIYLLVPLIFAVVEEGEQRYVYALLVEVVIFILLITNLKETDNASEENL